MASPGSALSTDIPSRYDVVINGFGYRLLDTLEPSIPFRSQRAIYSYSPTFLERTNVSQGYGDTQQAFWLVASQDDWSLGEQQKFYRVNDATSVRRYWSGTNVNPVFKQGQVFLRPKVATLSASVTWSTAGTYNGSVAVFGATSLSAIQNNTITNAGAHGLGGVPDNFAIASDGTGLFFSSISSGKIRRWNGSSTFTSFAATGAQTLAFVNNTLFAGNLNVLQYYNTTGTPTTAYTWQGADGNASSRTILKIVPYGGEILCLVSPSLGYPAELWTADTAGASMVAQFDNGFIARDMCVSNGIVYVAGSQESQLYPTLAAVPTVNYYANGNTGQLWQSRLGTGSSACSVAPFDNGVVIADDSNGTVEYYDSGLGGVSTIFTYGPAGTPILATIANQVVLVVGNTTAYGLTNGNATTSGTVNTSLYDFDSYLPKLFCGVTIAWENFSGDSGGSVDVAYQLNSLDGSYTALQTGVTSGTETSFAAATVSQSMGIQVTLNKNSSLYGPVLKRIYLRAAPEQQTFRTREYVLDLSGVAFKDPVALLDGTPHPLSGHEQAVNLAAAITSSSPFIVSDRFGSFYGICEPATCEIYEVREGNDSLTNSGGFVAKINVREVGLSTSGAGPF